MRPGFAAPACAHAHAAGRLGRLAPAAAAPAARPARPRARSSMRPSAAAAAAGGPIRLEPGDKVLLLGITGITGRSALSGLLAGGLAPSQLVAVTRHPGSPAAQAVAALGVQVVPGDLDDPASLAPHLAAACGLYIHALSGDAATADPQELTRGQALAALAAQQARRLGLVVYNSSGGRGANAGISQMDQKHAVEDVLLGAGLPGLMLEAGMFMEEFWKRHTRPGLLKGTFTFSLPGDRPLQLVAARDVGLAAAAALTSDDMAAWAGRRIPLAGDELTPAQMCDAFGEAQGGGAVRHSAPPAWLFWFFSRDLYRITRFLRETGFDADVAACRSTFPGLLSFREFLAASRWGDPARSYEQGFEFEGLPAQAAGAAAGGVSASQVAAPSGSGGSGGSS